MPSRVSRGRRRRRSSTAPQEEDEEPASPENPQGTGQERAEEAPEQEEEEAEEEENNPNVHITAAFEEADENTLRIMISTDNHLGYEEGDACRGNDSFAALEEVLYLAKHVYAVDMILLAGDLFHANKPSRSTIHKTIRLVRRYCLGPNPVAVQILNESDRHALVSQQMNTLDPYLSVDLPLVSIHGNHDDPSRDAGATTTAVAATAATAPNNKDKDNEAQPLPQATSSILSALDVLSETHLVNYLGRQHEVSNITVSPLLMQKGVTKLALYGLGSMRDERLNRMWNTNHVKFLKPVQEEENDDDDDEENASTWFHLFTLHQNRDLGRGKKNCVSEAMIPEWMDLVIWGHEHESQIQPRDSVMGTFRILQPGSTVATSLSPGEAVPKHCAILDIHRDRFRIHPVPLTQVRTFAWQEVLLSHARLGGGNAPYLDPHDPKVNAKVEQLLEERVQVLLHDAIQQHQPELWEAAHKAGNPLGTALMHGTPLPLAHALVDPHKILIRLRVDHTGFGSVVAPGSQRFGAKFIAKIANPKDVLLFHRKRQMKETNNDKDSKKKKNQMLSSAASMEPEELQQIDIEDLVAEHLKESAPLELYEERPLGESMQEFVKKEVPRSISEQMDKILQRKQNKLILNSAPSADKDDDDEDDASNGKQQEKEAEQEDDEENDPAPMNVDQESVGTAANSQRSTKTAEDKQRIARNKQLLAAYSSSDDDDDNVKAAPAKRKRDVEEASTNSSRRRAKAPVITAKKTSRTTAASRKRKNYKEDSDEEEEFEDIEDSEDEEEIPEAERPTPKARSGKAATAASRKPRRGGTRKRQQEEESSERQLVQSQLSFAAVPRQEKAAKRQSPRRRAGGRRTYIQPDSSDSDNDEKDNNRRGGTTMESGHWATADTETYRSI